MKKTITSLLLLAGLCATAQVKIGDNPTTVNASAVLEMESSNKGLLLPRMTTLQRNAIASAATGLTIYNTDTKALEVNTGTPAVPVWSSAKAGDVSSTTLVSSTSPAGTSVGQMMYNTGAVQPTGLVYWDGTQWKSVASSGGDTTNNFPVTNNSTVTNNNPVTNNSTSTFNGVSTFNDQAVFNDTAVFNNGMKVGNLPQGAITDSIMVFEPNTKEVRRLSIAGAAAAGEPWYKVGTTTGATANTDSVYLNGNVGIGTNNPLQTLDVAGTFAVRMSALNGGTQNIQIQNSAGLNRWSTGMGPAETGSGNTGGDYKLWGYADDGSYLNNPLTVTRATGNVGIGVESPVGKLDVAGNLVLRGSSIAGGNKNISIQTDAGTNRWGMGMAVAEPGSANAGGNFYLWSYDDNGDFLGNPLIVNRASGNVAMGTGSTNARLNIGSNAVSASTSVHPLIDLWATDGPIAGLYHSNSGTQSYIGLTSQNANGIGQAPIVLNQWGGNVGIGTASPAEKLDVNGNAFINGKIQFPFVDGNKINLVGQDTSARIAHEPDWTVANYAGTQAAPSTGHFSWNTVNSSSNETERMRLHNNGNLSINTGDYGAKLNIGGTYVSTATNSYDPLVTFAATDGSVGTLYRNNNGSKPYIGLQSFVAGDGEKTPIVFAEWGGFVGINTNTPKAPLHIAGTTAASFTTSSHSFITPSGTGSGGASGPRTDASIIAEAAIWSKTALVASATMTFSDRRIKNIIGQSDASNDLDLINKIRITDYCMKDVVTHGNKQYKKVIAQEVETVYPQAVTTQTGFVPNIYQLADNVQNMGNNTYKASFKNKVEYNKNVTGDLKLYDEQKEITAKMVSKGDNEIVFTTTEAINGDKLFLFGEEVTDFRAVDYEALSTLNISATQELYREVQALKKQNALLTAKVEDTKKLETAYNELAAQVKAMQEVLKMPAVKEETVATVNR